MIKEVRALTGLGLKEAKTLVEAGGKIKGSPEVLLEQAATLADRVRLRFADGSEHEIPSCYYEFARRYPQPDGKLYPGFVAASADSLFESTNIASMPESRREDRK